MIETVVDSIKTKLMILSLEFLVESINVKRLFVCNTATNIYYHVSTLNKLFTLTFSGKSHKIIVTESNVIHELNSERNLFNRV